MYPLFFFSLVRIYRVFEKKIELHTLTRIFAGAARRAGPDSMPILCMCVCVCMYPCVSDYFETSEWSKVGEVVRLLLIVPIEPWRNSSQFFGVAAFCATNIADLWPL